MDIAYERWKAEYRVNNITNLESAVIEGRRSARVPNLMTVLATLMGLLPIM